MPDFSGKSSAFLKYAKRGLLKFRSFFFLQDNPVFAAQTIQNVNIPAGMQYPRAGEVSIPIPSQISIIHLGIDPNYIQEGVTQEKNP